MISMKVGGLNACAITAQGMKNIASDTFAMCLPYIVKDDDEFEYVFDKVKGDFEQALDKQGFVTLGWAMTGWVNFFSRDPVVSPEDLKKEKIAIDTDSRLSKLCSFRHSAWHRSSCHPWGWCLSQNQVSSSV